MAANSAEIFDTLVQIWISQFGEAWEAMAGSRPAMSVQGPIQDPAAAFESDQPQPVWYRFTLGKEPGGDFFVGSKQWERIGTVVLAAAGVDAPSAEDVLGTCGEMLNQAAAGLARALSKQAGREILATPGVQGSAPPHDFPCTAILFPIEDRDHELRLVGSEDLVNQLCSLDAGDKPSAPPVQAAPSNDRGRSMELLLDVELPVSVSFGRAQLPLKDVLKLTTGSIVELNRSVSEPVEVIVNNCVIARGEVVVVEGNFGVRIREVVSRQERLQSLK